VTGASELLAPLEGRIVRDPELLAFAEVVGGSADDAVVVEGGRSQWEVGGAPDPAARIVRAPIGVVEVNAAEMIVLVRAGTTVSVLQEHLAGIGQTVALPDPAPGRSTVGGVLAVGHSGIDRLGRGHLRETLLQARIVTAEGLLVTAGGPTVKNVTGFDLARLLVGSLGRLGLFADLLLRTRPLPERTQWFAGTTDPFVLRDRLHRPTSILWDGVTTWVRLDGYEGDVEAEATLCSSAGLAPTDGPPELPPHRGSLRPRELRGLGGGASGRFVAEVGVGVVHASWEIPRPALDPAVEELHARLFHLFDPHGRLNPGRDPRRS